MWHIQYTSMWREGGAAGQPMDWISAKCVVRNKGMGGAQKQLKVQKLMIFINLVFVSHSADFFSHSHVGGVSLSPTQYHCRKYIACKFFVYSNRKTKKFLNFEKQKFIYAGP